MRIKGIWTIALTAWLVPVMSAVLSGGLAAQTPGPRMPFAGLEKLAAAASETVDVSRSTPPCWRSPRGSWTITATPKRPGSRRC